MISLDGVDLFDLFHTHAQKDLFDFRRSTGSLSNEIERKNQGIGKVTLCYVARPLDKINKKGCALLNCSCCLIGLYNAQVTLVKMVNEATANIPNWGS